MFVSTNHTVQPQAGPKKLFFVVITANFKTHGDAKPYLRRVMHNSPAQAKVAATTWLRKNIFANAEGYYGTNPAMIKAFTKQSEYEPKYVMEVRLRAEAAYKSIKVFTQKEFGESEFVDLAEAEDKVWKPEVSSDSDE